MESKSLLRNVALVGAASSIESALGLLAGVVIARSLGPSEYGHYAYSIWLCGLMLMLANHGLPMTTTRYLAEARGTEKPGLPAAVLGRLRRLQWVSMVVVLSLFILEDLIVPIEDWKDAAFTMLAISLVAIASRADFRMQGAVGKGYEQFMPENLVLIIMAPVNIALVLLLAAMKAQVVHYFALFAITGVASAILSRRILAKGGVRASSEPLPQDLKARLHRNLALTGLLVFIYAMTNRTVEMTLLKTHTDTTTVAYFAIAASLTKGAVDLLAGGMSAVLLPTLAKRFGQGGMEAMGKLVAESSRLYWMIGLVIAGLGLAITDPAVHMLYGSRYEGAIPALTCMLMVSGLLVINGASSAALNAGDKQWDRIRVMLMALTLNVALGFALIPRFGLWGALASYGCTQLFEACLAAWRVRRHTQVSLPLGPMFRALCAALACALAARWVALQLPATAGFIVGTALFLVGFTALTVLARSWRAAEFDAISGLFAGRGRAGSWLSARVDNLKERYNFGN